MMIAMPPSAAAESCHPRPLPRKLAVTRTSQMLTKVCHSVPAPSHIGAYPHSIDVSILISFPSFTATVPLKSALKPPKLAPSAWQLYFTDWIQRQQQLNTRKLNVAQAAKEAGQEYASLSAEEKEVCFTGIYFVYNHLTKILSRSHINAGHWL
jgi:hypothetical protein